MEVFNPFFIEVALTQRSDSQYWAVFAVILGMVNYIFLYRTQVYLGSDLWIRLSLSQSKTFLKY